MNAANPARRPLLGLRDLEHHAAMKGETRAGTEARVAPEHEGQPRVVVRPDVNLRGRRDAVALDLEVVAQGVVAGLAVP